MHGAQSTTSIGSSIMDFRLEHGRRYHAYKEGSKLRLLLLLHHPSTQSSSCDLPTVRISSAERRGKSLTFFSNYGKDSNLLSRLL
jgi:hypothetical protein